MRIDIHTYRAFLAVVTPLIPSPNLEAQATKLVRVYLSPHGLESWGTYQNVRAGEIASAEGAKLRLATAEGRKPLTNRDLGERGISRACAHLFFRLTPPVLLTDLNIKYRIHAYCNVDCSHTLC